MNKQLRKLTKSIADAQCQKHRLEAALLSPKLGRAGRRAILADVLAHDEHILATKMMIATIVRNARKSAVCQSRSGSDDIAHDIELIRKAEQADDMPACPWTPKTKEAGFAQWIADQARGAAADTARRFVYYMQVLADDVCRLHNA